MSIALEHVGKAFGTPPVRILSNISLKIPDGQFVSLTGRSGAGKSSLLYVISTLDNPTEGRVLISDKDTSTMTSKELHWFRNVKMGFVFQFHYLIAELTVLENILVPTLKLHQEIERRPRAENLIEQFGLSEKIHRYPRQLSGGEMQRVALARALIMQPQYLFADEPTGALDTVNAETVIKILKECNKTDGTTVIMVTHDPDFANMAQRQIRLADGKLVEDNFNPVIAP
jgi:ABC-type lipoprotein export system ATPase subunit